MPRKKIPYQPNLTYHTVSRCIELRDLLKPAIMKVTLEHVLRNALKKYRFELNGYIIMNNHFHFYIRTIEGGAPIHIIMQYIKSRFSEIYNQKMNRCGPFWNERYKCKVTEVVKNPQRCSLNVLSYIGNNAVKKGYVSDPRDYRYSSYRAYVDTDYICSVKITLHPYYLALGNTPRERVEAFLAYEKKYRQKLGL